VRRLTDEAIATPRSANAPFQEYFHRGPLVETPSAVWDFSRLLRESDFAAVGSNDLVEYLFAVDRNSASVSHLYRPEHPVVLRVLKTLVDGARAVGKPLSICGEIASDTRLLPVLVGLGVEDFAVAVGMLPEVQACLGRMSVTECRELADGCLPADDADELRTLIADRRACHPRSPPGKSNARLGAATP
jgi:phosphoenolpyruvate-protein kinase (PTS system EI component)